MSNKIVSVCNWLILILVATIMTGCGNEETQTHGSTADRTDNGKALTETYGTGGRDALRIRTDAARSRLWVLGLDNVRVYDAVSKRLVREIVLPNWTVARFICPPDMVLDSSGSAIISSNMRAMLWRIDADSFELKGHEIRLQGREQWDVGFGALAFAADGVLLALTSFGGSLWKIDVDKGSARIVDLNARFLNVCSLTTQFLNSLERSQQP